MKISMILTSLIVAMSAVSLTACEYAGNPEEKASDTMEQAPEVVEKAEELKNGSIDATQPTE